MCGEKAALSQPAPPIPANQRDRATLKPNNSPHLRHPPSFPRPVAREGSLGRRTEAAAGAERTGVLSNLSPSIARAGQGSTQRKAATDRAGGSPCDVSRQRMTWSQAARTRVGSQERQTPQGPSDGAFDPSAREVPVRVAGVTRTVPGLQAGAACPSWAPGVAAKNGACPELMSNSSRGGVVLRRNGKPTSTPGEAPAPRPALHRPVPPRRADLFLLS